MAGGEYTPRRRTFLQLGVTGALLGTAGCSQQVTTSLGTEEPERTPPDLDGATFVFRYDTQERQAVIEFTGGTPLRAGNVQIRTESGKQVSWAELGSTTTDTDQPLETGSTAVLGAEILNWDAEVAPDASIRLVYTGQETPATLGRFEPSATTTLTTTVRTSTTPDATAAPTSPPAETTTATPTETATRTATSTPTETATPTETPTETATDTPTEDNTQPSINAFSLANPSGRRLRPSFDSSERLTEIEVAIGGAASATLTADAFTETETDEGTYRYEASYEASIDGAFTATLRRAVDGSGNDGADGQSVELSVITTSTIRSAGGNLALDPPEADDKHAGYLGDISHGGTTLVPSVSASPRLPSGDIFQFVERDRLERVETVDVSGYRAVDDYSTSDHTLRIVSSVVVDNDADGGLVSLELTNTGEGTIELNTPGSYVGQESSLVYLGFVESQQGSGDEYQYYVSEDTRRSFSESDRWETYDISGSIPFVMTSNDAYSVAVGVYDGPADSNLGMTERDPPTVIRLFTNRVVLDPDETVEWRLGYTGLETGNLPDGEARDRLEAAESLPIPDDSEWEVFE